MICGDFGTPQIADLQNYVFEVIIIHMLEFYTELKKNLGLADAAIEYLEFCTRYAQRNSVNLESDIKAVGINFNYAEIKNIRKMPYQMYIITAYSALDSFLSSFRSFLEKYLDIQCKDGSGSLLQIVLEGVKTKYDCTSILDSFPYFAISYYRLLRNNFVHHGAKSIDDIKVAFASMERHSSWNKMKSRYVIKANDASFDDFILFSKCILDFADLLIKVVLGDKKDLVKKIDFSALKKFENKDSRLKSAKIQKIVTEMHVTKTDAEYLLAGCSLL